ncbi:MAG TPA: ATP-binding cassette domain-containing protein [Nannocystis exedens]|nr:ATP-binding cassette domain-containing protein [Nannocystis exedens]
MADPAPEANKAPEKVDRVRAWPRLKRLFRYTRPYRWRLVAAMFCLAGGSALGLVYPYFFGELSNAAFTGLDSEEAAGALASINKNTLILVAVFIGQSVFVFFRHYLMTWLGERVVADIRIDIFRQLVAMSQRFFHANRTGELLSRLGDDVTRLQNTVGQDLSIALRNLLTLVGGIIILLLQNPFLTGVMLLVVPALVIAAGIWSRIIRKLSRQAQDALARATGGLQEGLAAIETVQAFTREDFEVERYSSEIQLTFGLFVRRALARSWFAAVASFVAFSAIAGIFWLGGNMVVHHEIEPGQLISFLLYTMMVAGAVGSLSELFSGLQSTLGATQRIFEILDHEREIDDPDEPEAFTELRGNIEFRGVSFTYGDREVPVLRNINLSIRSGQVCALVGSSGSGKTTLGRLLLRFWEPSSGAIIIDGHDIRDLRLADLRGAMALVSQDPVLFSGSILENIRYGRLDASDDEIVDAARAANADSFIREFPEGYGTLVGERGVKLSGGQRQRVSIARAILRDPAILILDEATSALDSESEHLVQEALEALQSGRTTVVIAHRLSTIRDASRIVVLDHGEIVESGTHGELLAMGGTYSRLVARQATLGVSED